MSVWRSWRLPFFPLHTIPRKLRAFLDPERGVSARVDQRSSSLHIGKGSPVLLKPIKRNNGLRCTVVAVQPCLFFAGSWRRSFLYFRPVAASASTLRDFIRGAFDRPGYYGNECFSVTIIEAPGVCKRQRTTKSVNLRVLLSEKFSPP